MHINRNTGQSKEERTFSPMHILLVGLVSFSTFLVATAIMFWVNPELQKNLRETLNPSPTTVITEESPVVPNVTGLSLSEGRKTLSENGFNVGRINEITSFLTPGLILGQNPRSGETLARGALIDLEVAVAGPTSMPYLINLNLEEAESLLKKSGFNEVSSIEVDSTLPEGTIIKQQPDVGTSMLKGTPIVLTVSNGKILVPNVKGLSEVEARGVLVAQGFLVSVTYKNDPNNIGKVIDQTPETVKSSDKIKAVNLIVGDGNTANPTPSNSPIVPTESSAPTPAESSTPQVSPSEPSPSLESAPSS